MDPNIYKAPRSDLESEDKTPGSLVKAIGLGLVVDIGGTLLANLVFGIAWIKTHAGAGSEELDQVLLTPGTTPFAALMLIGLGMTVAGGYVCASIARRRDYTGPAIQGLILLGLGALGSHSVALGLLLFMNIATVVAVMGGAWLRIRRLRPRTPPASG